ncbi:DUF1656 domain-containing protein [Siccirubricoccus sp. KC 17139]|uniref:DUF1656 domain-containing protein n=1 Tax=Siccirubricoccus soli TaxID=2899147 RepID=A0ABT1D5H4_9PROT|nr:DUF1656 domain-containing protein [Siccirubricoccus soli]MCO6417174.1 DUF1656 domain-containing protein [Siccirubricoccus soli]MCP2683309.1 DUF1656 domain-containing protein [Siccirubricoccus soli]
MSLAEFDLFGLFIPGLLIWGLLALLLTGLLHRGLDRLGFYRLVWHPPLFDAAAFVLLLGGVVALTWSFQ